MDEVVVTALGIKRATKALSYNVQEVKGDELTTVKSANFMNSLAGKVAGVNINASHPVLEGLHVWLCVVPNLYLQTIMLYM